MFVSVLALLASGAQDPEAKKEYAKDGVLWAASWKEAQEEAFFRNVPIYIAFHKDESDPCLEMANTVYPDKKFIEASRMWVNVAAHRVTSHSVDVMIKGKKVSLCSRYWNIPCATHSMCYEPPKRKYGVLDECPFRIFADPESKELARELGAKSVDELLQAMAKIQERVPGAKITGPEWIQVQKLRGDGEKLLADKEWAKAIDAYTRLGKFATEKVKLMGEDGLERVGKEGEKLYVDAIQLAQSEDKKKIDEGVKLFRKIAKEFKPLPVAKKADEQAKAYSKRP